MREIADALAALTWEGGRIHRAWVRFEWIIVIVAWLIVVGVAIWLIWTLWVDAMWHDFWLQAAPAFTSLNVGLVAAKRLVSWHHDRQGQIKADALRQAAAAGNDQIAPKAVLSSASDVGDEPLAQQTTTYGPFKRATSQAMTTLVGACLVLAFIGALLDGIGIFILITTLNPSLVPGTQASTSDLKNWLFLCGVLLIPGALFLVLAIIYGGQAWRIRGPVCIAADDCGIRQVVRGGPREELTIAWHEIRAFYRIRVVRESLASFLVPTMLYAVDDGIRLVAWVVTDETRDESYKLLCHAIFTHTRIPLRDLSSAASSLSGSSPLARPWKAVSSNTPEGSILPPGVSLPRIWTPSVTATILAPFLIAALIAGLAWSAPYAEPLAYRSLVARIHAETPLFHDALDHDDGLWPVHTSNADGERYVFTDGGYAVTGIFSALTLPAVYQDVAVEVSVAQPDGNTPDGAVGLALRQGNNAATSILFTITYGTWSISRGPGLSGGDFNAIYDEANSAIHSNGDAANQLLIVMRGHQYLCFINGQLVGGYTESQLSAGYVGLFVSDGTTGVFSNLTVYPAPA